MPVQEVNRLLAQFDQMQGMMKQMKKGGMAKMMRAMGGLKAGPLRDEVRLSRGGAKNGQTLRLASHRGNLGISAAISRRAGAPSGYSDACAGIQAAGGMRSTWPG